MEKQEALTILRRNVINQLNIRTPGYLPCQPDLARSGQVVRFLQSCIPIIKSTLWYVQLTQSQLDTQIRSFDQPDDLKLFTGSKPHTAGF